MSEATKLKHSVITINPYESLITADADPVQGLYLHRTTGTNYDDFDLLVSKYHQDLGMKVSNPLEGLNLCRSKDSQALFFKKNNIPAIKTLMYRGKLTDKIKSELSVLSRDQRYILKMNRGNQGIGVNYIESKKSLHSFLETFNAMNDQKFIIQPYISHKVEWRLFIIKNVIQACIQKNLAEDDFRGNSKRSTGKLLKKVPNELKVVALDAFSKSGLDYAGIDILLSEKGEMLVLEINPIPGFEQAEELSGQNIARELIVNLVH